ncbi:MAG: hypothetical protein AB4368_10770 [Xenococcaceae cyanobacterium]
MAKNKDIKAIAKSDTASCSGQPTQLISKISISFPAQSANEPIKTCRYSEVQLFCNQIIILNPIE